MDGVRPEVMAIVRRAAMVAYVHAKEPPRLDDMATTLDAGIDAKTLDTWRREDQWDVRRGDLVDREALDKIEAERRRIDARAAVEHIHNRAFNIQRVLKPKTWEAAAGIQLRCAETLRQWADDDVRRAGKEAGDDTHLPDVPKEAWSDVSEEQWQAMAHAALSMTHRAPEGKDN